jgi:hypothetical protein
MRIDASLIKASQFRLSAGQFNPTNKDISDDFDHALLPT